MSTSAQPVIVVGSGISSLCAALHLSNAGHSVKVLEQHPWLGGKIRSVRVGAWDVDAGPTVLTMPWVFQQLFEKLGRDIDDYVRMRPLDCIAKHAWPNGKMLSLYSDTRRSFDAIERAFGQAEAEGYARFSRYAQNIYDLTKDIFIAGAKPTLLQTSQAMWRLGLRRAWTIDAQRTMMRALRSFFSTPELQQLFARYATYVGSDPWKAPATLNVIAHVEKMGVYSIEGGMRALADALVQVGKELGVDYLTQSPVERVIIENKRATHIVLKNGSDIACRGVIFGGDAQAMRAHAQGLSLCAPSALPPRKRSLSALTVAASARIDGFDLDYHTVFFSEDYASEFSALRAGHLAKHPTLYLCARQRCHAPKTHANTVEPVLTVINAPARISEQDNNTELTAYALKHLKQLERWGLHFSSMQSLVTTPQTFETLFPSGTGAIYGRCTHSAFSMFARPSSHCREAINLKRCGGSTHPGAGVPMAALSGTFAAQALAQALAD